MEWFETWFDTPYYHILYKNRDYKEAENFLNLMIAELNPPQGSKIIDLACGKGRHSVFLNKMGFDVLGLDLSKQSIDYDKEFENETLHFEVHDMRAPINAAPVDIVMNLFTSFGYFDQPEDDKKVFQSVYDILKPGGYFVLDYMNQQFVRNTLVDRDTVIKENIEFDIHKKIISNYIVKEIRFEDQNKDFQFTEKVKLHTAEQINNYADEAGFQHIKLWGNYQLENYNVNTSPRCISLYRKK